MVEELVKEGLRDERIAAVMGEIPRHRFVDAALITHAYDLRSLPIGHAQTISSPLTQARMTELLQPGPRDRLLEVGTGSGYQTAILARLSAWIFTIEAVEPLGSRARRILEEIGYDNILCRVGDGAVGWRDAAPFDGILVTAAAPQIPESLLEQLREGGRLVCPVGDSRGQAIVEMIRRDGDFERRVHERCLFVPLVGKEGWQQ